MFVVKVFSNKSWEENTDSKECILIVFYVISMDLMCLSGHEPEKKDAAVLLNLENVLSCMHSNIQIGYYFNNLKKSCKRKESPV